MYGLRDRQKLQKIGILASVHTASMGVFICLELWKLDLHYNLV